MIKIHVLCCNDFPEKVFMTRQGAELALEQCKAREIVKAAARPSYSMRDHWHLVVVFWGPPIHLPRRAGGGHWEVQLGRLHFLFNHCGSPIKVRLLNKDYEYD